MVLDCFQKVLTMPDLWCSWGIWMPPCMFPSALPMCSSWDARVWGCRGEHGEATSVVSFCSKWWALLLCPCGSKNHCVHPPRAISPVEPRLLGWRLVPLPVSCCLPAFTINLKTFLIGLLLGPLLKCPTDGKRAWSWEFDSDGFSPSFSLWLALQPWQVQFILFEP